MQNINTTAYWDRRFGSGDWEAHGGHGQTFAFAESQIAVLGIDPAFAGTLCDFGCACGDAFPVYRRAYPNARLVGVDFSAEAIRVARERYGDIAEFVCGGIAEAPPADVIIASNVMEHLTDDEGAVEKLLARCSVLHVIVPFREQVQPGTEHLRSYDVRAFARFRPLAVRTFVSRGWSEFGWRLWKRIYLKNIFRVLRLKPLHHRNRQILYTFRGTRTP